MTKTKNKELSPLNKVKDGLVVIFWSGFNRDYYHLVVVKNGDVFERWETETWYEKDVVETVERMSKKYPDLPVINATRIGYYVFPNQWRVKERCIEIPNSVLYEVEE